MILIISPSIIVSSNSNCISVDDMSCSTQILIMIELNVISSSSVVFSMLHSMLINLLFDAQLQVDLVHACRSS